MSDSLKAELDDIQKKALVNEYENHGLEFIKDDYWRLDAEIIVAHYLALALEAKMENIETNQKLLVLQEKLHELLEAMK